MAAAMRDLIAVLLVGVAAAVECVFEGPSGTVYDMQPLVLGGIIPREVYSGLDADGFEYEFNVCEAAAASSCGSDMVAYQLPCVDIAEATESPEWEETEDGVLLSFSGGGERCLPFTRAWTVAFRCAPDGPQVPEQPMEVVEDPTCTYTVAFETPLACRGGATPPPAETETQTAAPATQPATATATATAAATASRSPADGGVGDDDDNGDDDEDDDGGSSDLLIVGFVLGSVALVAGIGVVGYAYRQRRRREHYESVEKGGGGGGGGGAANDNDDGASPTSMTNPTADSPPLASKKKKKARLSVEEKAARRKLKEERREEKERAERQRKKDEERRARESSGSGRLKQTKSGAYYFSSK